MNTVCVYSFPLSQLLFSAFFSCSINTSLFLTTADQPGFVFCTMPGFAFCSTPAFGAEKQLCLNSWNSTRTARVSALYRGNTPKWTDKQCPAALKESNSGFTAALSALVPCLPVPWLLQTCPPPSLLTASTKL